MGSSTELVTLILDAKNLASKQIIGLQRDLRKVGDDGDRMGAVLKRAGAVAGGVMAGGFALAAKGAAELSTVQANLQASTGMTADEAQRATEAINAIAGRNLVPLSSIAAAMEKVHNDLGLTGDAAATATELFVKFSRATGQDAAQAVTGFDDILDAWNMTAADAGTVMDKLIVSHQKFGGTVAASETALSAMAPAMQAANMSIDDGVALLNLFNASGIDASKVPAMLSKAVKALKPGQGLNDLIAQIGAIEDPTARAQRAMVLFGAKTGVGMAQAIKPGMDSLADFGIAMTDAQGATLKAADAMDSSFPAAVQKGMAAAAAAVRGFGDMFGPALMGAAAITSMAASLGLSLSGAWKLVGTIPAVLSAAALAGAEAGGAYAAGAGSSLGGSKGLPAILAKLFSGAGIAIPTSDMTAITDAWHASLAAQEPAFVDGYTSVLAPALAKAITETVAKTAGDPDARAAWKRLATAGGATIGTQLQTAMGAPLQAAKDRWAATMAAMGDSWTAFNAKIADATALKNLPDQIILAKAGVASAQKQLEAARTAEEKAAARIRLRDARAELATLRNTLASEQEIARLRSIGLALGKGLADPFLAYIREKFAIVRAAFASLGSLVQSGGGSTGSGSGVLRASGGPVSAGWPYIVGERGPELFVPRSSGNIVPNGGGGGAVGGSFGAVNVTLVVNSTWPPTNQQVAQMADTLDAELRRRFTRHSPYQRRG